MNWRVDRFPQLDTTLELAKLFTIGLGPSTSLVGAVGPVDGGAAARLVGAVGPVDGGAAARLR